MFPDIGVIRRTLEGEIQRGLDAAFGRLLYEAFEITERPEGGVYGFMAALFRPYRPGAPGVLAACAGRIEGTGGVAMQLGINPNTLRARMKKLGIAYGRDSQNRS